MKEPRELLTGLAMGESPRWHEGRLWFSNWGAQEIIAVDLDGEAEVVDEGPSGFGWATEWLPDGRMLVTGEELTRHEPDGSVTRHADLSGVADHGWSEIVVSGRGNIYVNGFGFDFLGGGAPTPGEIALVRPDGTARLVADGLDFPNGMAATSDDSTLIIAESFAGRLTAFDIEADGGLTNRRVWADLGGAGNGDGICLDDEGAVWTPVLGNACARVREGGEVLERVEVDQPCFACMLGGPGGRTLFMLTADWRGGEEIHEMVADRTGKLLATEAPAPHAGYP